MYLIEILKEPSTYAGLAPLALLVGFTSEEFETVAMAAAGVFGFAAVLLRERGKA